MSNEEKLKLKEILSEIKVMKNLMIVSMIKSGATSKDIGLALGVSDARVRQIFPIEKIKTKKGE